MRVCVTRTCHVTPSASRIRVLFSGSAPRLSSAAFTTRTYRWSYDRRAVVVNEHTLITTRDATISQSTPRIGTGVLFHG